VIGLVAVTRAGRAAAARLAAAWPEARCYEGEGGAVRQPAYDPSKPHQIYPPAAYQRMLAMSDEDFYKLSQPEPPVKIAV